MPAPTNDTSKRPFRFATAFKRIEKALEATRIVKEMGGELPAAYDVLTSFNGVGPKCANLALGVATGALRIAVDIHVHRVTNRWGIARCSTCAVRWE